MSGCSRRCYHLLSRSRNVIWLGGASGLVGVIIIFLFVCHAWQKKNNNLICWLNDVLANSRIIYYNRIFHSWVVTNHGRSHPPDSLFNLFWKIFPHKTLSWILNKTSHSHNLFYYIYIHIYKINSVLLYKLIPSV